MGLFLGKFPKNFNSTVQQLNHRYGNMPRPKIVATSCVNCFELPGEAVKAFTLNFETGVAIAGLVLGMLVLVLMMLYLVYLLLFYKETHQCPKLVTENDWDVAMDHERLSSRESNVCKDQKYDCATSSIHISVFGTEASNV